MTPRPLGWIGIVRLGLVQAALGGLVVLTTSTLNRIMVVELGLAAIVPGALVGLHYGVQIARPLWGHGSDRGKRRTPWILGGMALLAVGSVGAATATAIMAGNPAVGLLLAAVDFVLIGAGVGAAGTSLLAMMASSVAPARRPAAATVAWLMMILGIAVTATVTGRFLDPFSMERLVSVAAATAVAAVALSVIALAGVEAALARRAMDDRPPVPFRVCLAHAWSDPDARLFTVFVAISMLAYSMQDLILEPFAGLVFGMTPGETTQLSGIQNGGVFVGMVLVGAVGTLASRRYPWALKAFTVGGCILSALALAVLSLSGEATHWPLPLVIVGLGFANGVFAVAAIASMMSLAGAAGGASVGLRMGLWGAAQAVAFGAGSVAGTVVVDILRASGAAPSAAYSGAFLIEAGLFLVAAAIASRVAVVRSGQPAAMGRMPAVIQPAE